MRKKAVANKEHEIYSFPTLIAPIRRFAVNDNEIPLLKVIIKHIVLMGSAFGVLYLLQSFI